jgi:hypothetical protein
LTDIFSNPTPSAFPPQGHIMNNPDFKSDLLNKTLNLLKNRPSTITYKKITANTDIPTEWIKQLATNRIDDPGVKRIETLFNFLKSVIPTI